jgi:hypothetical protein
MIGLNGIKDEGGSVREFYNSFSKDFTKIGDALNVYLSNKKDITNKNGNSILLDLHGFSHDAAKIVIELFLDEVKDRGNPFYIECGKSSHIAENKNKMRTIAITALTERGLEANDGLQTGCFTVSSYVPSPDTETRSATTNLAGANSGYQQKSIW